MAPIVELLPVQMNLSAASLWVPATYLVACVNRSWCSFCNTLQAKGLSSKPTFMIPGKIASLQDRQKPAAVIAGMAMCLCHLNSITTAVGHLSQNRDGLDHFMLKFGGENNLGKAIRGLTFKGQYLR